MLDVDVLHVTGCCPAVTRIKEESRCLVLLPALVNVFGEAHSRAAVN